MAFALTAILLARPVHAQKQDGAVLLDTIRVQDLKLGGEGHDIRLPGYDYVGSPTFSPDGRWIAFDAYRTVDEATFRRAECWVVRRDGTEPKKLAAGATPRWSPDGERLLFMREDQADPSKDAGIFLVGRDGKDARSLCAGRWPDWSPEGRRIVFSRGGRPGGGARALSRVYVADVDGTGESEVAEGDCPSWSIDGTRIAFCKRDRALPAPQIRVLDLDTEREEILGFGWWRPNWSPDGKALAAVGVAGQDREVGMIRFVSGDRGWTPELLLDGWKRGLSPSYSRDGKAVVYAMMRPVE